MKIKDFAARAVAFVLTCLCATGVHAVTLVYDFAGQCDDCAFNGNPGDPGFGYNLNTGASYLNDGLTQSVSGRLTLQGAYDSNGVFIVDLSTSTFRYDGSSLVNPFIASNFSAQSGGLASVLGIDFSGLTPSLQTQFSGSGLNTPRVTFVANSNVDPNNPPTPTDQFPNFCTPLGQQLTASNGPFIIGIDNCDQVPSVFFSLDASTNIWSISGNELFDQGGNGQLVYNSALSSVPLPGSLILLASGLLGFSRFMRLQSTRSS